MEYASAELFHFLTNLQLIRSVLLLESFNSKIFTNKNQENMHLLNESDKQK